MSFAWVAEPKELYDVGSTEKSHPSAKAGVLL
jgi:hypothetical protein